MDLGVTRPGEIKRGELSRERYTEIAKSGAKAAGKACRRRQKLPKSCDVGKRSI